MGCFHAISIRPKIKRSIPWQVARRVYITVGYKQTVQFSWSEPRYWKERKAAERLRELLFRTYINFNPLPSAQEILDE